MTRLRLAAAALALAAGSCIAPQSVQPSAVATVAVPLDTVSPQTSSTGRLRYLGGVEIREGARGIGGISSLEWSGDTLVAVQDDGMWLRLVPQERDGILVGVADLKSGRLRDLAGDPLGDKDLADAESITGDGRGGWLVGFEQDHRIWRYASLDAAAESSGIDPTPLTGKAKSNSGLETMARVADGLLLCGEYEPTPEGNCAIVGAMGWQRFGPEAPAPLDRMGGVPTDAACAKDGTCYILFRSYSGDAGVRGAIVQRDAVGVVTPLAVFEPPLVLDNYEGLALREAGGRRYLYIASDDNFSAQQRTLLLKFEILGE